MAEKPFEFNEMDLVEQIKSLAEEYPKAVYNPSDDEDHATTCLYTKGYVDDGPSESGCIVTNRSIVSTDPMASLRNKVTK